MISLIDSSEEPWITPWNSASSSSVSTIYALIASLIVQFIFEPSGAVNSKVVESSISFIFGSSFVMGRPCLSVIVLPLESFCSTIN